MPPPPPATTSTDQSTVTEQQPSSTGGVVLEARQLHANDHALSIPTEGPQSRDAGPRANDVAQRREATAATALSPSQDKTQGVVRIYTILNRSSISTNFVAFQPQNVGFQTSISCIFWLENLQSMSILTCRGRGINLSCWRCITRIWDSILLKFINCRLWNISLDFVLNMAVTA